MGLEIVCHVSDILFIPVQKVPIWVWHGVLIITSSNIEVLTDSDKSLWYRIQEVTIGIGFVEILYVLQEFIFEVTGRGRTVDI